MKYILIVFIIKSYKCSPSPVSYYLPPWRRIAIDLCIKRLSNNDSAGRLVTWLSYHAPYSEHREKTTPPPSTAAISWNGT